MNIYEPKAAERIRDLNPASHILVQLRDPIERLRSYHALKHVLLYTREPDFAAQLAAEDRDAARGVPSGRSVRDARLRDLAVVSSGLARFVDIFGRDRVHITLYEDFARDPHSVFAATFGAIGVDPSHRVQPAIHVPNRRVVSRSLNRAMRSERLVGTAKRIVPRRLHPVARFLATAGYAFNRRATSRGPLDPRLLARLREDLRPEVEKLSALVGRDLADRWWPAPGSSEQDTSASVRARG